MDGAWLYLVKAVLFWILYIYMSRFWSPWIACRWILCSNVWTSNWKQDSIITRSDFLVTKTKLEPQRVDIHPAKIWRGVSSLKGWFSGSMLVFEGVRHVIFAKGVQFVPQKNFKNRPGGWNLTPLAGLGIYIMYWISIYLNIYMYKAH